MEDIHGGVGVGVGVGIGVCFLFVSLGVVGVPLVVSLYGVTVTPSENQVLQDVAKM